MIETLEDLNLQACCCELPLCPVPVVVCESLQGEASCSDSATPEYDIEYAAWVASDYEGDGPDPIGCYAPFEEPVGDPLDDIPRIYRRLKTLDETVGVEGSYFHTYTEPYPGIAGMGPGDSCEWTEWTWSAGNPVPAILLYLGGGEWWTLPSEGASGSVAAYESDPDNRIAGSAGDWVTEENECSRTETTYTPANSVETKNAGTPVLTPSGVASAWPISGGTYVYWHDLTHTTGKQILRNPITKAELMTEAAGNIPGTWPGTPEDSLCIASLEADWPTIQSCYVGDPEAWPACGSAVATVGAIATATKARVRFQIPSTWQLPAVPFPGTYFKITYDILEEPDGWDDTIDDPDYTGDPPAPQIPKPGRPLRSYVSEDNVLVWTGPGTGAPDDPSWFTDWIVIDPPTVPGTRRIVNIRFVCRENWFIGEVPQVTGDSVTLPDP